MDYIEHSLRDGRLVILRALGDQNDYRLNETLLARALEAYGHNWTRERVRDLQALEVPAKLQADLAQAKDLLSGLEGSSEAAARALGGLPKAFEETGAAAAREAAALDSFLSKLRELSGAGGGSVLGLAGEAGTATAVEPFAAGGVVDRATLFGYGGGRLGLMGEAGPEAIMPLRGGAVGAVGPDGRETSVPIARLGDGRLGVKAFAGGGVIGATASELTRLTGEVRKGESAVNSAASAWTRLSERFVNMFTERAFTQILNSLFGGATAGGAGGGGLLSGLFGSALPFAKGGVVDQPEYFSTGAGLGLRGEAGPEAILPLRRGADGRLGVASAGGESPVNITFHVTAPDADSFRRSEGQLAAMLSRAVNRGARNR